MGLDLSLNKIKYLCIGETLNNLKLDRGNEIESCQERKYLGVICDSSGKDDNEIKSIVIQERKYIACLNVILYYGVKTSEGREN
jgi:hypothetical protein